MVGNNYTHRAEPLSSQNFRQVTRDGHFSINHRPPDLGPFSLVPRKSPLFKASLDMTIRRVSGCSIQARGSSSVRRFSR